MKVAAPSEVSSLPRLRLHASWPPFLGEGDVLRAPGLQNVRMHNSPLPKRSEPSQMPRGMRVTSDTPQKCNSWHLVHRDTAPLPQTEYGVFYAGLRKISGFSS